MSSISCRAWGRVLDFLASALRLSRIVVVDRAGLRGVPCSSTYVNPGWEATGWPPDEPNAAPARAKPVAMGLAPRPVVRSPSRGGDQPRPATNSSGRPARSSASTNRHYEPRSGMPRAGPHQGTKLGADAIRSREGLMKTSSVVIWVMASTGIRLIFSPKPRNPPCSISKKRTFFHMRISPRAANVVDSSIDGRTAVAQRVQRGLSLPVMAFRRDRLQRI